MGAVFSIAGPRSRAPEIMVLVKFETHIRPCADHVWFIKELVGLLEV
jgi:hypothetical protein